MLERVYATPYPERLHIRINPEPEVREDTVFNEGVPSLSLGYEMKYLLDESPGAAAAVVNNNPRIGFVVVFTNLDAYRDFLREVDSYQLKHAYFVGAHASMEDTAQQAIRELLFGEFQ